MTASGSRLVVKVSGSLLDPPSREYLASLAGVLKSLRQQGYTLAVVTGGGRGARERIEAARRLGVPESILDEIGIEYSRVNALTLAAVLYPYSTPRTPKSITETVDQALRGLIPVAGGMQPGQSTNAVAAGIAEALGAGLLVNMLHGVKGVYDPAPGAPGSRLLDKACYSDLERIISGHSQTAGGYALFDHVALRIAERSRIGILFVDGSDPKVLLDAASDPEGAGGTLIGPCRT
ncbi:MAG: UMP kinase [Desulfurococcales archaeon]|nr:UMP kinase [Desulfurococcales archaeon]